MSPSKPCLSLTYRTLFSNVPLSLENVFKDATRVNLDVTVTLRCIEAQKNFEAPKEREQKGAGSEIRNTFLFFLFEKSLASQVM